MRVPFIESVLSSLAARGQETLKAFLPAYLFLISGCYYNVGVQDKQGDASQSLNEIDGDNAGFKRITVSSGSVISKSASVVLNARVKFAAAPAHKLTSPEITATIQVGPVQSQ